MFAPENRQLCDQTGHTSEGICERTLSSDRGGKRHNEQNGCLSGTRTVTWYARHSIRFPTTTSTVIHIERVYTSAYDYSVRRLGNAAIPHQCHSCCDSRREGCGPRELTSGARFSARGKCLTGTCQNTRSSLQEITK
jgi:hypothetical protein